MSNGKKLTVSVSQNAANKFEISSSNVSFSSSGGSKTLSVTSATPWSISSYPDSWCTVKKNGNSLTVNVASNSTTSSKDTYFKIKAENKEIKVNVSQKEKNVYIYSSNSEVSFGQYGGSKKIYVETNAENYKISGLPDWCYILNKGESCFDIVCKQSYESYARSASVVITAEGRKIDLRISQDANARKRRRRENGGTLMWGLNNDIEFGLDNDAVDYIYNLGFGLKLGNYASYVQLELGAKVGFLYASDCCNEGTCAFRLPLYARVKINLFRMWYGRFFVSGMFDYNILRDNDFEDECSVGGGLGIAYRNFEWDVYYKLPLQLSESDYNDYIPENRFVGTSLRWFW